MGRASRRRPAADRAGIAGVLEAFGGSLLLVGLFTRPVAFLLSGEMAFAYFIGHAPMYSGAAAHQQRGLPSGPGTSDGESERCYTAPAVAP